MGAAPSAQPAPPIVSQAFADRAARIDARIAGDASGHLLQTGQEPLLRAELDTAKHANDAQDASAPAMLDVIERQLAQADLTLSRADNGQTIVARVGDTVTVGMSDTNTYDVRVSDMNALMLHRGVMFIRGVQGVYDAKRPAIVTLDVTPRSPAPAGAAAVRFVVVILKH